MIAPKINPIEKAGGILFRDINGTRKYLILFREKQKDYSFPKGHLQNKESTENAAKREFFEETGLKIKIIKRLTPNQYLNTRTGKRNLTHMFLFELVSGTLKTENKNDKLIWATENELRKLLSQQLYNYFRDIKKDIISALL